MKKSTSGGSPGNPTITELAPNVVSIGPDYNTGGVVFEVYDATATAGFKTILDVGDALDARLTPRRGCHTLAPPDDALDTKEALVLKGRRRRAPGFLPDFRVNHEGLWFARAGAADHVRRLRLARGAAPLALPLVAHLDEVAHGRSHSSSSAQLSLGPVIWPRSSRHE